MYSCLMCDGELATFVDSDVKENAILSLWMSCLNLIELCILLICTL